MFCKKCGAYNLPYKKNCRKCGENVYKIFWEGTYLRNMLMYGLVIAAIIPVNIIFDLYYNEISFDKNEYMLYLIFGIILSFLFISFLKKKIKENFYLIYRKNSNISLRIYVGVLISICFIIFPILNKNVFDFIIKSLVCIIFIAYFITFCWLLNYEKKNGNVIVKYID